MLTVHTYAANYIHMCMHKYVQNMHKICETYTHVHKQICVHKYVCMYTCIYTYIRVCKYIYIYSYACMHIYICIQVYISVCEYTLYMYMYKNVCIHIYLCTRSVKCNACSSFCEIHSNLYIINI